MFRAEQAGRAAAEVVDPPVRSEADVLRFRLQLRGIEERVAAMPRMDAVLRRGGRPSGVSRRFAGSLRDAEQTELRLEQAAVECRP